MNPAAAPPPTPCRVLVCGASGTIGQATVRELARAGHRVTAVLRNSPAGTAAASALGASGAEICHADVTSAASLAQQVFAGRSFDVAISTMASRTGSARDSWAIDYHANTNLLDCSKAAGVSHLILLSAICVQRPQLPFQHAKLAFERALRESGMTYSIVRPTAFFKSLSGQVERVRRGKPYVMFGNGELTRCKPISDADLARYLVDCIADTSRHGQVLPIGGPGPAISPLEQGHKLFELLGRKPRFRHVPIGVLNGVIAGLSIAGKALRRAADGADYARIARYYATESMLVFDQAQGRYSPDATPETGSDTLFDHYAALCANSLR